METLTANRAGGEFIATYSVLVARCEDDENSRALLNAVALETIRAFERQGRTADGPEARSYFLCLLKRKGFRFRGRFRRDVDVGRHQVGRQAIVKVPIDELVPGEDPRLVVDPREQLPAAVLADQLGELLSEDEWCLLYLRHVEAWTLQELADREGITPPGMKKRLDKLGARLRKVLEAEGATA